MSRQIEGSFEYKFRYYRDFTYFNLFRGKYHRLKQKLLPVLFTVFIITMALISIFSKSKYMLLLTFIILLCGLAFIFLFKKSTAKVLLKNKKIALSKKSFVIDKNKLIYVTEYENEEAITEEFKMNDFTHIYETVNAFYFYLGKGQAIIVPKDCLDSDSLKALIKIIEKDAGRYIKCM